MSSWTSGRRSFSTRSPDRPSISSVSPARSFSCMRDVGHLHDPLLVGPADDEGPLPVLEDLLQGHDLAVQVDRPRQDHVERLVEHDLLALLELGRVDLGVERHPHLAAGREDVDAAVLVGREVRPVPRRRHRQLLDLLAEGGDVLPGFPEGGRQLLVLRQRLGELALRLEEPLLQGPDPLRGVLQPPAQADDLLLQRLELALEIGDFPLVFLETLFVLGGRGDHLLSPGSPYSWARWPRIHPANGALRLPWRVRLRFLRERPVKLTLVPAGDVGSGHSSAK